MMIVENTAKQSWQYTLPVNGGGAKMKAATVCTAEAWGESGIREGCVDYGEAAEPGPAIQ